MGRRATPLIDGVSTVFISTQCRQAIVVLDLKDTCDAATLQTLAAGADILAENFGPTCLSA